MTYKAEIMNTKEQSYQNGFDYVVLALCNQAWQDVRDEHMKAFPNDFQFKSIEQYKFAQGQVDALLKAVKL